ncbi:membrane-associated protein, putative [Bodo saltans]|uniref:Membrane-associated protein, putative n=1 Tax=Bodo saltans TaxID=75058 RepID=A0A0S4JN60_BODSA|nr:membrane-associated protein, putative [Bodo saltans]|eukprot:CUG91337.1 membrane-associated protein, putative [Bodo saltans]
MISWPVAVLLFLMLSNDLSGTLACRALAGFFVLAIAGLVVFISAASMGLEVPGGIANFTCNSTSLSSALNGSGTIEAEERNFFTGCDRGWSELLNYNGMRVGRKCCVKVDIRNLNCQGTGLRLVADATANTQVLTDTSEREAAVRCCPSVGAEVTPTGYASMITTALSATLMSILVNLLRHLGVFRALITSPLQSFLACMSGLSEGCGSCLIALFGLCINKRVLLGDRGRSVRSREKLTVSSELVNTLTSALSSTFNGPATMVPMMDKEEQPAAAYQEKEAASGVTEVTEFAVDGKHVMSFETATAVTMCGRYSLVFGHAISGAPHELLYDMKYQAGIHGPVRMKHEHNDAGAETRDAGQRLTSRIPSRGRNVWFSECSRFVVYEHDDPQEHCNVISQCQR